MQTLGAYNLCKVRVSLLLYMVKYEPLWCTSFVIHLCPVPLTFHIEVSFIQCWFESYSVTGHIRARNVCYSRSITQQLAIHRMLCSLLNTDFEKNY